MPTLSRRTRTIADGELLAPEKDAVARFTHARSMRLVDCTDATAGGTVSPIRLGKRVFLATAAHVIPDGRDFMVVSKEGRSRNHLHVIARHVDAKSDVGLLEIIESDASRMRHTVSSNEFLTSLRGLRRIPVIVTGYPGAYIADVSPGVRAVIALTFTSVTLPSGDLPDIEWDRRPNRRTDIFVEHDPEGRLRLIGPDGAGGDPREINHPPPSMRGVSGAAMWMLRFGETQSGLRVPLPLLLGIQTSWMGGRFIRGTRIGAWLDLVEQDYPDLIEEVRQARAVRL